MLGCNLRETGALHPGLNSVLPCFLDYFILKFIEHYCSDEPGNVTFDESEWKDDVPYEPVFCF